MSLDVEKIRSGDKIRYLNCTYDDPRSILREGAMYTVKRVEVHTWHTRVRLEEVSGEFNSCCFEEVSDAKQA